MGTGATEYSPPEWLTTDFLQDVLKDYFKDNTIEVKAMVVQPAVTSSAVGFASEMHRATFDLIRNEEPAKFSVIIKDHPKGHTGAIAQKSKLFKREILSYKEIIPRVEELLASIDDSTKIAPACYYTTETPEPFLILEDMAVSQFDVLPKGQLVNMDYALPVMRKLAKLHACSAVMAAENPKLMEFFEEAPISRNPERKEFLGYFPATVRTLAEEVCTWRGYEEIGEKLYKLSQKILIDAVEMYEAGVSEFRVFNSADLWVNNLMFHYADNKEPDDVVLLDYQLAYYGSPSIDLNYFLFGSLNENVRKVHFKYIVREYQLTLQQTLEKLNYKGKIPTLKDVSIDMIKNSLQGVIGAVCLTPLILTETNGFENLEQLSGRSEEGDRIRRENVQNPRYRAYIQRTLKEFELSGFLE